MKKLIAVLMSSMLCFTGFFAPVYAETPDQIPGETSETVQVEETGETESTPETETDGEEQPSETEQTDLTENKETEVPGEEQPENEPSEAADDNAAMEETEGKDVPANESGDKVEPVESGDVETEVNPLEQNDEAEHEPIIEPDKTEDKENNDNEAEKNENNSSDAVGTDNSKDSTNTNTSDIDSQNVNANSASEFSETVNVIFEGNADDVDGEMKPLIINIGEETALPANQFTRNGYTFVSWNTKEDGTGLSYGDKEEIVLKGTESLTLYAVWAPDGEEDEKIGDVLKANNPIYNNGAWGIYIDIYNESFNYYATWMGGGGIAYGPQGCTWFASARVFELTGIEVPILAGSSWPSRYSNYEGFSFGHELPTKGKAIACFSGHVSIIEAISGDTVLISEGGYTPRPANGYCSINEYSKAHVLNDSSLLGFVYLPGSAPDPEPVNGAMMTSGYDRVLPDGDYIIASAADPKYYLDIYGGNYPAGNMELVDIWHTDNYNVADQDAWTITYSDGFYRISQYHQNVSLEIDNGSTARGMKAQVWANDNVVAQQWAISRNGNFGYRIQARCSGFSLDIDSGNMADGTRVSQWNSHDGDNQRWVFIPYKPEHSFPEGRYILTSAVDSNYILDVPGNTGDLADGAQIQVCDTRSTEFYEKSLSKYSSFDVKYFDSGYYQLVHSASGKVIDVNNWTRISGEKLQLFKNNKSVAQLWAITPYNGGYMLRAKISGLNLDVDGTNPITDGTRVQQCDFNGSSHQVWYFVPAEHKVTFNANGGKSAPSSQIKYYKGKLTITSKKPTRDGYTFVSWNTKADGSGTSYKSGAVYKEDADLQLYAQWKKAAPKTVSVTKVNLDQTVLSLKAGGTATLKASISPSDATNKEITWTSSNTKVATVDGNGKVTAKSAGTADIKVTTEDGKKTAVCKVTVSETKPTPTPVPTEDPAACTVFGFCRYNGKDYWYENGVRQAVPGDPKNLIDEKYHTERGREIYDPKTNAWYWLDSVYDGAKAVGKEVWMPYIYQEEANWSAADQQKIAYESDPGMGEFVFTAMQKKDGKWVRYDQNGKMMKGWVTITGDLARLYPSQNGNIYYYDTRTGLMAKGWLTIEGKQHHFDEISGKLLQ